MGANETLVATMPFFIAILAIFMIYMVRYNNEKQRHEEVMAALEKGLPPSEIMALRKGKRDFVGPNWIRKISIGVFLLILSAGLLIVVLRDDVRTLFIPKESAAMMTFLIVGLIAFALGVGGIVSGILNYKEHKKISGNAPAGCDSKT
jgi:hypothetical protein